MSTPLQKDFISAESLLRDSMSLAGMIVRSGFRPSFLVAMWRGGAPIGITVQEVLEYHAMPTDHIAIRTSYYLAPDQPAKTVRVHAVDYLVSRLSAEDALLLVDDVFDSGRKKALLRERESQLSQTKENLAKLTDAVELSVETAFNKLERTQQMLKVSEEVLSLRAESNRVRQQELIRGVALKSQADTATAQEYDAKSLLLRSQMDYLQARDELLDAMGSTP